jgi:hypothetical protein
MHILYLNYDNVLIGKLLHALGLSFPSSGSAELYTTIGLPFYHSQYVELSQILQCVSIEMDMCTGIGAACRFECVHSTGD